MSIQYFRSELLFTTNDVCDDSDEITSNELTTNTVTTNKKNLFYN